MTFVTEAVSEKMGCCPTKIDPVADACQNIALTFSGRRSRSNNEVTALLLGCTGSGKSTFFKQMKLIHLGEFSEKERHRYCDQIVFSVVSSLYSLFQCDELTLGPIWVQYIPPTKKATKKAIFNKSPSQITEDERLLTQITELFQNDYGKNLLKSGNEDFFSLVDFASRIDEISKQAYMPTAEDILHVRTPTTCVSEIVFGYRNIQFKLIDVGGRRHERHKWISLVPDVNVIIFLVDISTYEKNSLETGITNTVMERPGIIQLHLLNKWLTNSTCSFILFLNKTDLF